MSIIKDFISDLFGVSESGFVGVINRLHSLDDEQKNLILDGLDDFMDNRINHLELSTIMLQNGVPREDILSLFDKLFKNYKNFTHRVRIPQIDSYNYIYRFIEKNEFNSLISGNKIICTKDENNGNMFNVSNSPVLDSRSFARVKLKYTIKDPEILQDKPQFNYYFFNVKEYYLNDVIYIDRILPNGYLQVYVNQVNT